MMRLTRTKLVFILWVVQASGCGVPRDPEGTYQQVRDGTLRVGITDNPPWTHSNGGQPRGLEVELLERLASELEAEILWTRDAEGDLFESLRWGQLDVVVGGLSETTPWSDYVSLSRPYSLAGNSKRVMAVRQGENRWLLELEKFLQRPLLSGRSIDESR